MSDIAFTRDLFIVLAAAFTGGFIAKILKLPLVIGYLVSGIGIGRISSFFIGDTHTLNTIAQLGVTLLLFTLGLEFTIQKVKDLGEVIIFGAFIQIVLTTLLVTLVFPVFGFDFLTSLIFGIAFSLSSTAVAVKTLSEKGELDTLPGSISAGWLFMQDLYTLPIMIILPVVGNLMKTSALLTGDAVILFIKTLVFAGFIFWTILIFGKKIVPFVMQKVTDTQSRELIIIATVSICFLFATLFQFIGFSAPVGAFVAGLLIASSSLKLGIFTQIRPLRDFFSVVFFVTLGFLLDPFFIFAHLIQIGGIVFFIFLVKFVISSFLVYILGYHTKTAIVVGLSLVSVGEFSFLIAIQALSGGLIQKEGYLIILSASLMSLLMSVPFISNSSYIYSFIRKSIISIIPASKLFFDKPDPDMSSYSMLENHVIVLGYGRVGKYVCRALTFVNIPFIVIDYDHRTIRHIKEQGITAIFGDPSEIEILKFANIEKAKAVVLAYADRSLQDIVITNILNLNSDVKLLCRTHFEEDQRKLKSLGVHVIVQPEFEAAVSITEKILKGFRIEQKNIEGKIARLRIEHGLA